MTMTYLEDLSPYTFLDGATPSAAAARNVGWLEASHDFPTEEPPPHLLDRLWEYCSILIFPTRGLHDCEFCSLPSSTFVRNGTRLFLGSGEIRVFNSTGEAFAAPNLIYHYVLGHHYRPPHEFLRAVEDGPRPGSDEYRKLLERLAVDWRENTPLLDEPKQFRFVRTEDGVEAQEKKKDRS
jgi:hypothetical protein